MKQREIRETPDSNPSYTTIFFLITKNLETIIFTRKNEENILEMIR